MVHRRLGDGARGVHDPAAHRRRDDVAGPHRGQDRAGATRARSSTSLDASRAVGVAGALVDPATARRVRGRDPRRVRDGPPRARRPAGARGAPDPGRGAGQPRCRSTGPASRRRGRRSSASGRSTTTRSTSSSSGSTGRRSSRPGSCAAPTRRSSTTRAVGRGARDLHRDARALLERIVGERAAPRATRVVGFWPANDRRRRHRAVRATRRGPTPLATLHTLRQQMVKPPGRPNLALADFVAPRESGVADFVGAFAVTAGHGLDEARRRRSRRPTTTTRRSWPRPSPTGWPRRSPSGSTSGSGASCGATPRTRRSRTTTSSPSATRASGRRPATRPARTTPRRGRSSSCSRPRRGPGSG